MSADKLVLGKSVRDLDESPAYDPINCVRVLAGTDANGNQIVYTAGDPKSGRTLDVENRLIRDPTQGQQVADNILQAVQGYAYKPYSAAGAILDPAAEIGDGVSVDEVYSVLADIETTFSPLMTANIGAPEDGSIDHEYPYESSESYAQRRTAAELGQLKTEFIVQNGEVSWAISQIGAEDQEGSIWNKLTSVQTTVDGITVRTEKDVETIVGSTQINWAKIDVTPEQIKTEVEEYFDASGAAASAYDDALRDAKKYTDDEIEPISGQYNSKIEQTAKEIKATVAAQESKWDLSGLPSGVTISVYGYGSPTAKNNKLPAGYDPVTKVDYTGKYYLDQTAGRWYYSDGTTWTRQTGSLKLITTNLSTSISTTAKGLASVVSAIGDKDDDGTILYRLSKIEQTSTDITLSVYSNTNGTTYFKLSDGSGEISSTSFNFATDILNVAGDLTAKYIAADVSINSPTITGGTISSAVMTGGRFTDDGLGSASLSMVSWGGLASMVYAPTSRLSDWYGRTYSYFDVGGYGSGQYPQAWMELGGVTLVEKRSTGVSSSFVMGGYTWDFRNVRAVIMPDGTTFEAS